MPTKKSEKPTSKPPTAKDITNREYFSGEPTDTSYYSLSSSPEIPATPPEGTEGIRSSSQGSVVNIFKAGKEKDSKTVKGEEKEGKDKQEEVGKQGNDKPQEGEKERETNVKGQREGEAGL